MRDSFGRQITYLRVSVTDRCDLRCLYCMDEKMTFLPRRDLLSLEELERICSAFIDLGVRKIRITGGEPLVRKNVEQLFQALGKRLLPADADSDTVGLRELTLTTNGTHLQQHAAMLAASGVRRVNVSLDSLRPEVFRTLSRGGDLAQVLAGIDAASEAGLAIKINTVALRGMNEDDILPLVRWCGERCFDLTFIETMPMGEAGDLNSHQRNTQYWPLRELRAWLHDQVGLTDLPSISTGGPARYSRCTETAGRLGFITPLSHTFCESCNRVRLTCTGQIYMCLGQDDHLDLRTPARAFPHDDRPIQAAIQAAITRKPEQHNFHIGGGTMSSGTQRKMNVTGG